VKEVAECPQVIENMERETGLESAYAYVVLCIAIASC
jgi:hypothetical protein